MKGALASFRRLLATLQLDVTVQARSQLYTVGILVALITGALIRWIATPEVMPRLMPAFIYMALGNSTWIFGASMVLFERQQRTIEALRVSPLRVGEYIASKTISLTLFAMFESLIVLGVNFDLLVEAGGDGGFAAAVDWTALLPAMALLGATYTLIGVAQVVTARDIADFLIPGAVGLAFLVELPLLHQLGISTHWAWNLVPTAGALWLLQGAFVPLSVGMWVFAVAMSLTLFVAMLLLATRRLRRHLFLVTSPSEDAGATPKRLTSSSEAP